MLIIEDMENVAAEYWMSARTWKGSGVEAGFWGREESNVRIYMRGVGRWFGPDSRKIAKNNSPP